MSVAPTACSLQHLVAALPEVATHNPSNPSIMAITSDSRQVQAGTLFVAYVGVHVDGHRFITDALARGAVAIVGEKDPDQLALPPHVPYLQVPDGRAALARLSAAWHGWPARRLRVIGVTGTDGKTTTVTFIRSILEAAGHRTGMISTVAASIGDRQHDTGFHTTTPDAGDVQRYLAEMVQDGAEYAVLEATSEGLAQKRVEACEFDVAVVTNITHEHLSFHGTFEAYREAKATLFRYLSSTTRKPGMPKVAVINADDPSADYLRSIPADRHITYGLDHPATITARDIQETDDGCRHAHFTAVTPLGSFPVQTNFPGRYNVSNALASLSVGVALGLPVPALQAGLQGVAGVPGRLESIDMGQDFTVIVDFAHTPRALQEVLSLARRCTPGRLICVFGCAGLRDVQKRSMMGEVAARLADLTILTAEDPRTEDVTAIIAQIAAPLFRAGRVDGRDVYREPDRARAIRLAINLAESGDVVLICGKGHERSMCWGTVEYPWSDQETARQAIQERWRDRR